MHQVSLLRVCRTYGQEKRQGCALYAIRVTLSRLPECLEHSGRVEPHVRARDEYPHDSYAVIAVKG